VVGNKDIVLVLFYMLVSPYYLYRDKEQPTCELAPYYGRVVISVLYSELTAEYQNGNGGKCG
jgi:hypothetical protein